MTEYCFVSTRIAKQTADGQPLSPYPIAYLLGPQECNNDSTNFWIFSEQGLKRLIDRTGWSVLSYLTIGDTTNSTPADPDRDERAFCLLQSKTSPTLSASPNPVPAGERMGRTTISWNTADEGEGKSHFSRPHARIPVLQIGSKQVPTTSSASTIPITRSCSIKLSSPEQPKPRPVLAPPPIGCQLAKEQAERRFRGIPLMKA